MSVYTSISEKQFEQFLSGYPLGRLNSFQGIEDGIENTNYAFNTLQGDFILTIFESIEKQELSAYLDLLMFLSGQDFPCPKPQPNWKQCLYSCLANKPAAIFKRLPGASLRQVSAFHCREVGLILARLHLTSQQCDFSKSNRRDGHWLLSSASKATSAFNPEHQALIEDELQTQVKYFSADLPESVIHADLFRDNVLFDGDRLTAVLDFYSACRDFRILDLAIAINDWCVEDSGTFNREKMKALVSAYQSQCPLTTKEQQLMPIMLRRAALRFWLSRLEHRHSPRRGVITQQKDPAVFRRLLQYHREN